MAFTISDPVSTIISTVGGLLDKLIPDSAQRDAAKFQLLQLDQQGKLEETKQQLSAIIAEANSSDPWTSRARPSFMYVIYIIILAALPMSLVFAFFPDRANAITGGFGKWLAAIPDSLYTLFGVGYLGYTGARSYDKKQENK